MSKLSEGLRKIGIPKAAQRMVTSQIPGISTATAVAAAASKLPNPFIGVVRPGTDAVSQLLGLGPKGQLGSGAPPGGAAPRGYHWSHRSGKWVRNRRMNMANGRAIRRAARRLKGAEKMFRKVLTLRHGHVKGSVVPKGKGRR